MDIGFGRMHVGNKEGMAGNGDQEMNIDNINNTH